MQSPQTKQSEYEIGEASIVIIIKPEVKFTPNEDWKAKSNCFQISF